ncbi:TIGR03899 family protein [Aliivibrio fischeri]|nr:TIGR03899 family protein [Aliivibrio fischeri]MUJ36001.1 TIGR03899 family protein [Aliivibrio fischeri]
MGNHVKSKLGELMNTQQTIITKDETTKKEQPTHKKEHYVVSSARRLKEIAIQQGLAANLQPPKPEETLLKRALYREKLLREQQQQNLEKIVKLAHDYCNDETAGDPDPDWLHRFFEMAKDIHDSSMQKLWSQIFKQEVISPGSTSMKALKVLKDMTQREAQTFQRAASLACSFGQDNSKKLLLGYKCAGTFFNFYKTDGPQLIHLGNYKLPYSSLLLLIELGLLLSTELESGEIEFEPALPLQYQGKNIAIKPMQKGSRLVYYRFSPTGAELCKLLGNKPNENYYDNLISLLSQKFMVETDVTAKSISTMA